MRIFLGGIPLGCDNIGDEAILESVVGMLRRHIPGVEITVATADPATAQLLGVKTVPSFGFAGVPVSGFTAAVKGHDAYVWCGATGLSDYPHVALDLLERAHGSGVASFVWGVGMDDELNPVFFKVSGRRRRLLSALGMVGFYERHLKRSLSRRIAAILPHIEGVWLRDPESAAVLAGMGFEGAGVAADTAFTLKPPAPAPRGDRPPTLGLCISTQRQVSDLAGLRRMLDSVRASGARIVGIPMNPKTDRLLLDSLRVESIKGTSPRDVMEAAAGCDAVLSSRLHLLILAANAGTRILGIARGAKLANWLRNFGLEVEGSVQNCDWRKVEEHVLAALASRGDWDKVRDEAYARLNERFETARADFIGRLIECSHV